MTTSTGDPVPLFVPTRSAGALDVAALQWGHRPDGVRVGIAFSSAQLLRAATGPRQEWVRLHESSLREMLAPFGISVIQLDPMLVGPDVAQIRTPELVGHHGG
ncbi:SAV_915 family protein [Kribbella ginsengisoli]|uniref:SAV_915 family protein n=1 Tax=Kribbella ginsengisoli TaxID=363865 RepID=UPI0031D5B26B